MTDQDRITEYLFQADGKSYCDDCLSTALGIPLPQVQEETTALAEEGWSKRSEGPCAICGSVKLVSKRRTGSFAA